ncbi:MAG: hypothetical protein ACOX2N_01585 [Peptococcia bacterium]|jgi:hypothetical protein
MTTAKIRKMFPGNNTSEGFYSFYDYMINFPAVRVFILKGGPGTGKSTLMKKIGSVIVRQGYEVEYHYCSSSPTSLDGLVIPFLRIAIVDGTEPHVVEPKYTGAVEEIVNLGDFWDKKPLLQNKEKIIELKKQKVRMFQLAYNHLREGQVVQEELVSYYQEAVDLVGIRQLFYEVSQKAFKDVSPQFVRPAIVRRLFASANTPQGYVTHLENILQDAHNLYFFTGTLDQGKEEFLEAIYRLGISWGIDCQLYHCPFNPVKLELVYFPKLAVGFLRSNDSLLFSPSVLTKLKSCQEINFDQYLDIKIMQIYEQEIKEAKKRLFFLKKRAWGKLKAAQKFHDQLEELYFPAIDFTAVNKKSEELLNRILAEQT